MLMDIPEFLGEQPWFVLNPVLAIVELKYNNDSLGGVDTYLNFAKPLYVIT